jgi:hypothetical protein
MREWGRSVCGLFNDAVSTAGTKKSAASAFAWKEWARPRNASVRIDGLQVDRWTRDFPNTKQK